MAQPRTYTQTTNFNDFTVTNPSDPHPGSKIDTELTEIKQNTDDLNVNIALIQRDDGKLKNEVVHKDSFDQDALALIGASGSGFVPKGDWTTATAYVSGDIVTNNDATYLTVSVSHTSGSTFAGDKALGYWQLIANSAIETSAASVDVHTSIASQVLFTTTYTYADPKDIQVFVNGLLTSHTLYTITNSGGTSKDITFTTAPATGATVIIWGASVLVEAAKAGALTYRDSANNHKVTAERWSDKVDGTVVDAETSVDSSEYSSKAYAIGGAGISTTLGKGAAKEWAVGSGLVDTADYSAKEYAAGVAASTGGSAKDWAMKTTAIVDSVDYSSKEWAAGQLAANSSGSAKQWALGGGNFVEGTDVIAGKSSARKYATNASDSASAASTSEGNSAASAAASAASYELFDDRFLGAYSTATREVGANAGLDNDGDVLEAGTLYFDTTLHVMKAWNNLFGVWERLAPTTSDQANITTLSTDPLKTNINTVAGLGVNGADVSAVAAITAGDVTKVAIIPTGDVTKVAIIPTGDVAKVAIITTGDVTKVAAITTGDVSKVGVITTGDVSKVADITTGDVSKVADIDGNVTIVAGMQGEINSFAVRYRVGATDPNTSEDDGDLFWNTSSDELKIYNATAAAWQVPYLDSASVDNAAVAQAISMSIALG